MPPLPTDDPLNIDQQLAMLKTAKDAMAKNFSNAGASPLDDAAKEKAADKVAVDLPPGLTYDEVFAKAKAGAKVRRRTWKDDNCWMTVALEEGQAMTFMNWPDDGPPCLLRLHKNDLAATDWEVLP